MYLKQHKILTQENFYTIMNFKEGDRGLANLREIVFSLIKENCADKFGFAFKYYYGDDFLAGLCLNDDDNEYGATLLMSAFLDGERVYEQLRLSLDPVQFRFERNTIHPSRIHTSVDNLRTLAEELIVDRRWLYMVRSAIYIALNKYRVSHPFPLFTHRHPRIDAVINAIKRANTLSDIRAILHNQKELFETGKALSSHNNARAELFLTAEFASTLNDGQCPKKLENSTFYRVICEALSEVEKNVADRAMLRQNISCDRCGI